MNDQTVKIPQLVDLNPQLWSNTNSQSMDWFQETSSLETVDFPMKIMGLSGQISFKPVRCIRSSQREALATELRQAPRAKDATATRGASFVFLGE